MTQNATVLRTRGNPKKPRQTAARIFFFAKKKQKTLIPISRAVPPPGPSDKSLFASFSPEKEGLASLPLAGAFSGFRAHGVYAGHLTR